MRWPSGPSAGLYLGKGITLDRVRQLLHTRFGVGRVDVAWIGGRSTWAAAVPEGLPDVYPDDIIPLSGLATPWGPLGRLRLVNVQGRPLLRIPVHGWLAPDGSLQPSVEASLRVFYLLHELGVRCVLIDAAVAGVTLAPGDLLIPTDLIDPHHRPAACDLARRLGRVSGVRMAQPFCPQIRARVMAAVRDLLAEGPTVYEPLSGMLYNEGIYGCAAYGPLETAAEVRQCRREGWSVIGPVGGLEALLARILGLHLALIAVVTHRAEGLDDGSGVAGLGAFYRACAGPVATVGWQVARSLVLEGVALDGCACEALANDQGAEGLPLPNA